MKIITIETLYSEGRNGFEDKQIIENLSTHIYIAGNVLLVHVHET